MKDALCMDCRDFLQSNHDDQWRRFKGSLEHERSPAKVVGAADKGCCVCKTIVNKFKSLKLEILSLAQENLQPVKFCLLIREYYNTTMP
jgi:hypothetical protein